MPGRALLAFAAVPVVAGVVFVAVVGGTADQPARAAALPPGGCAITAGAVATSGSGSSTTATPESEGAARSGVRLSAEQVSNARAIVAVVKGRGLPQRAAVVAVTTAWTESTLHNYGSATDHDSLGLFQQRPSQGWGTAAQVTDVVYATGAFLDRLVKVAAWQRRDVGVVAQAVQRSAVPAAYDQRGLAVGAPLAAALWDGTTAIRTGGSLTDRVSCVPNSVAAGAPSVKVRAVLARAKSALGLPYCWAGGTATGPSHGTGGSGCGGETVGFDCSGLALYAWAAAGVTLPHLAAAQAEQGRRVPLSQLRPGDLVFLANPADGIHHVMIVWSMRPDGTGQVIEAQDFGVPVHIRAFQGAAEPEIVHYGVRLA